jgi:hypothetical protein
MDLPINHVRNNSHIEITTLAPHQDSQVFWRIQRKHPITGNVTTNLTEYQYDLDRQEYTNFSFSLDNKPQNPIYLTIKGSICSDSGGNNHYDLYVNNQLIQPFKIAQNITTALTLIIPEELLMDGQNLIAIRGKNDWVFHIESIDLSTGDLFGCD